MHTFHTPEATNLRVELEKGRVDIYAEDTDQTSVELTARDQTGQEAIDHAKVEQRGTEIVVLLPKVRGGFFGGHKGEVNAVIRMPRMSNADIETASADVTSRGQLGNFVAATGSGDLSLAEVADASLKTGSGDVEIDTVNGSLDGKCGSGDLQVRFVGGNADLKSGSGDVEIDDIAGNLKVKTGSGDAVIVSAGDSVDAMAGSGDLTVKRVDHGRVKAKTGSGDISVGVADGTAAYLDISTVTGDVTSSLDASDAPTEGDKTVELTIQSGTGDVVLQRA